MSYCDYNPRLFKPFTSMKTKIVPAMSDDWEIVNKSYVKTEGMGLYSKKLNQTVQDISLRKFLTFLKTQNVEVHGDKLQGKFIIGNDRAIYTTDMYNTWKEKYDKRTEVVLDKNDLIPGHSYKTPCGAEVVYLGKYYLQKVKYNKVQETRGYYDYTKQIPNGETQLKPQHLIYSGYNTPTSLKSTSNYDRFKTFTQKATQDLGEKFTPEECLEYVLNKTSTPRTGFIFCGVEKDKNLLLETVIDSSKTTII